MRNLKAVLLALLTIITGIVVIFTIELFLNGPQIKALIKIASIIIILLSIFVVLQILARKDKRLKIFKSRFYSLLIILIIFIISAGGFYISIYNVAMHEAFGNKLTVSEKIEQFLAVRDSIKLKKDYETSVNEYIDELNSERIDYVTVYYDDSIDKESIETIRKIIPRAEKLTAAIYGDLEEEPLRIIFYSDEERFKVHGFDSDTVQGFFDGDSIHMKAFSKDDPQTFVEEIFTHEYSHYAYNKYAKENKISTPLPSWFNEGLAEYISVDRKDINPHLDFIRNPEDLKKLHTMEDLLNSFGPSENNENFFEPYYYSYFMVESMVDMKGEEAIREIILNTKDMDFYDAFETVMGVSIEEYQKVNLVEYMKKIIDDENNF